MDKSPLNNIKGVIEHYYKIGPIEDWKNRDYQNLSFQIHQKTKVLISTNTLKRIFGKLKTKENYLPQSATLEALESYVQSITEESSSPQVTPKKKYWYMILSSVAILLIVLALVFLRKEETPIEELVVDTSISVKKIEGKNTATVYFDIEGEAHKTEDIRLSFGEGGDTITLPKGRTTISHFYKYPGAFKPRLIHNEKVVRVFDKVLIPSDGWMALGSSLDGDKNFKTYPIADDMIQKEEGYWHMTVSDLEKCGMDRNKLHLLRLYNYQQFNVRADDFYLALRMKNVGFWPEVDCNNINVIIQCENGIIRQPFPKPGCSYWITSRYSEIRKSGKNHDMSAFCSDLSEWGTVEIQGVGKELTFIINKEEVYKQSYKRSLGEIIGIQIQFFGTGYIDSFELQAIDGTQYYSSEFSK